MSRPTQLDSSIKTFNCILQCLKIVGKRSSRLVVTKDKLHSDMCKDDDEVIVSFLTCFTSGKCES